MRNVERNIRKKFNFSLKKIVEIVEKLLENEGNNGKMLA